MSHEDFESARAYLQSTHIHDHLSSVLQKIVREKPDGERALREFESWSVSVKEPMGFSAAPTRPSADDTTRILTALTRTQALIRPPITDDEDDTNVVEAAPNANILPDLAQLVTLYEHAGIGLARSTIYQLSCAMHNLVREHESMEEIRFFGKILGTIKDYYICECKLSDYEEEEHTQEEDETEDPNLDKKEPAGTGVNEYVYFVTNSLVDAKWIQLPAITPEQISTARGVRRFLTGDLSAPVLGFPRFPWGEATYLRVQITRITHATMIAPKGYYSLDEEEQDEVMIQNEEFSGVKINNQLQTSSWVHIRPHLLQQGRLTNYIAPEIDEDDDTPQPTPEPIEPHIKLLSTLEQDYRHTPKQSPSDASAPIPASLVESQCWSFRISPRVDNPHAVVSAHSITWPGSVSICRGKQYTNIYVGWGLKLQTKKYVPARPPPMMQEFVPNTTHPLIEQTDPITRPVNPDDDEEEEKEKEDDDVIKPTATSDEEDDTE